MSNASPSLMPPSNRWWEAWLRYFPFESRSWRQVIADSDLSSEAKITITSVVGKSRLMRFEKLEVVHELIAHFADGKIAGQTYSQLVADFGNPEVTARLIRRSKIRNRPIMFRIISIFGWALLALIGVYATFAAYFHMGKPTPSVDYLAEYNEGIASEKEDDLAWTIYRPVWKKFGFSEGGGFRTADLHRQRDDGGVLVYDGLKRPTDEGWDLAVDWLQEHSELLDAFRAARFKPRLGVPLYANRSRYSEEDFEVIFPGQDYHAPSEFYNDLDVEDDVREIMQDSALHILLPHIQPMRTAARMIKVDTRLAIAQGDADRVATNFETMIGIGRQAADSNTLVGSLVGFACIGISYELLEEVLTEHPDFLDEDQLARIQAAYENESLRNWLNLGGERAFVFDTIQRVYTDDGAGDGRLTATGFRVLQLLTSNFYSSNPVDFPNQEPYLKTVMNIAAPVSLFVVAGRKDTTEVAERLLDQFESRIDQPYWEKTDDEFDVEAFLEENQHRYFLLANLMPAYQQVHEAMIRTIARRDGVVAALASQRHFLKYDAWPESFDQLSPEFIVEFPVDQMNGQFLKIKAEDQGVLIYSVGHDLDDDGGTIQTMGRRYRDHKGKLLGAPPHAFVGGGGDLDEFDADWILWPQSDWKTRLPEVLEQQ